MFVVYQDYEFSLSATILLLLLLTTPSSCSSMNSHSHVKTSVFLSPKIEVKPGTVFSRFFYEVEFPKGHIGLKGLNAEIVDEELNPVPLYEAYIHHWVMVRYHKRKHVAHKGYPNRWIFPHKDYVLKRNSGPCQKDILSQYFGLGSEGRGTNTDLPDPFGIEIGNPQEIPQGFEEKWMINIHAIDMRGVQDATGCSECRCDLYNVTKNEEGLTLPSTYKGGFLCCYDNTQCKLREGFKGAKRSLYLKYTIKWVEWDQSVFPVDVYILDVTDQISPNSDKGLSPGHNCWIEYEIKSCKNEKGHNNTEEGDGCLDVKRASIPMKSGGYLIYAVAHQHAGAIGSTLYGQDGRVLCSSKPKYGKGTEAGNEEGYIVGMTTCYPQPGSVNIVDGETLIVESNYTSNTKGHTGVMTNILIFLAKRLPHQNSSSSLY